MHFARCRCFYDSMCTIYFCCQGAAQLRAAKTFAEPKLNGSRTPICLSSISQSLAPIGVADFARLRRHSRRIAARNFCKSEIRLTGNRDCAPAAAAYDANPPAAPPNSRERDTISALAGARRRPLGAAVAQSRECAKIKRRKPDENVAHPNC